MTGSQPMAQQSATTANHSPSAARAHRARSVPGLVNGLVFPPASPLSPDESQAQIVATHERLVQALIGESDVAAHVLVEGLLEIGVRAETLLDDAFPRAARALGELWCADDADFYTVTVGMTRLHRLVHEVSAPFLAEQAFPGSAGRILLCGIGNIAAPQRIIDENEAALTEQFERTLIICIISRLVGVDEG